MPRAKNIPKGSEYWREKWRQQKARGEDKDDAERAKARRAYDKAGIKRDGKHIEHVKKIAEGGKSSKGNTKLRDPKENMSDNGHKKGEKAGVKRTNKVFRSK